MPSIKASRIAIDLTPLLPGGTNGGIKLVAVELVKHLARLAPQCEFVLLTSDLSHDQLAFLDAPNVTRRCVLRQTAAPGNTLTIRRKLRVQLQEQLVAALPAQALGRVKAIYRRLADRPSSQASAENSLLKETGADLLFCPFTAPFYATASVPTVSLIVDLQYLAYPQFFSADDFYYRDRHFKAACAVADRLVCISDYVRQTVLENSSLNAERVTTIQISLPQRISRVSSSQAEAVLDQWKLAPERYLLYPANFWAHKNHEMLLTAFSLFRHQHPASDLKLVCTGAPDTRQQRLREATTQMGLQESIVFPGYLADVSFAALLQSCRAVIFPSLYEGFGMPVLEAMAFDKPVLCSNVTSLPEVGGDAALCFDPRQPQEIAAAINRIENDPALISELIDRGHRRVELFGDAETMARQYWQLFQEVLATRHSVAEVKTN